MLCDIRTSGFIEEQFPPPNFLSPLSNMEIPSPDPKVRETLYIFGSFGAFSCPKMQKISALRAISSYIRHLLLCRRTCACRRTLWNYWTSDHSRKVLWNQSHGWLVGWLVSWLVSWLAVFLRNSSNVFLDFFHESSLL